MQEKQQSRKKKNSNKNNKDDKMLSMLVVGLATPGRWGLKDQNRLTPPPGKQLGSFQPTTPLRLAKKRK